MYGHVINMRFNMSDDRIVLSGVLCLKGSLPNESGFTVPWGELFTKQGCLDFVDFFVLHTLATIQLCYCQTLQPLPVVLFSDRHGQQAGGMCGPVH